MGLSSLGIYACLFLSLYFEVFLLISFLEKRPYKKTSERPSYYPSVSMVVPCFNEGKTLAGTISSLLNLDYPAGRMEILVVDDGSTDDTREIGERFARERDNVHYFYKENGGKYTALNFGIEKSEAQLVGCLDADSFVERDALIEVVKRFNEDTSVAAIVPVMRVHDPKSPLEVMQMAEYTFGIFVKKIFDNLGAITVLPGPFSIYRRDIFKLVGPFRRAHNTEDMEIAFRIQKAGLKIVNAHTAFVNTTVPKTVGTLVKQRTRWTQGFLQNARDYWFMFGNPKFGNFGLFSLPMSLALLFGALYMTLVILYQTVTHAAGAVLRVIETGVLPRFSLPSFDWFYFDTSALTFIVMTTLGMTFVFILMGKAISKERFGLPTIASYIFLYGFLAPLWLFKAVWGTILAQESTWR
ncbi:MAG TPA: glycosyltransferase [Candidatus Paceibacterota bacterium]|nr:glycosyltransferase [Candidatus Paceibacterota bacterium]